MEKAEIEKIAMRKGKEVTDRIYERIESENLPQNAAEIILGLCFIGMDNIMSEEFVQGAKRVLEIAHEEYINAEREIINICGDKTDVF